MDKSFYDDYKENLIELLVSADRDKVNELLDELASKSNYREVNSFLLEPVLFEMGNTWLKEDFTLAQGYVATKIAQDALEKIIAADKSTGIENEAKGVVVLGNAKDDHHALGKNMVATFLHLAGWEVHDLGVNVDAKTFVDVAIAVEAQIIAVSAMIFSTAENIKEVRKEIDAKGLKGKIFLAVGGAVFKARPELVKEVGADGTAQSAVNVPGLFDEFRQKLAKGA